MPVELSRLIDSINPTKTVLLFGAGSSAPSGAPSAHDLAEYLSSKFNLPSEGFSLSEVASLAEQRASRQELIQALRDRLKNLHPTGGLLNLPLYDWKSIYTTNYDTLIEASYKRMGKEPIVYTSDFDFTMHDASEVTKLFKLHGTIEKDVAYGDRSRMIITESDYDHTGNYRQSLYDRLRGDMAGSHLVIIGHSLKDPDIRAIANRAAELGEAASGAWKISLLLYSRDEDRAELFEKRNFTVCFGGIDEFFASLARKHPSVVLKEKGDDPLSRVPALRPTTLDVGHASEAESDVSDMFNGWPATHADIVAGLTFERNIAEQIEYDLTKEGILVAVVLGASGVGKTTAARQALQRLRRDGHYCWEHHSDHALNVKNWEEIAQVLMQKDQFAVLMIDDAHAYLQQINQLIDGLVAKDVDRLKLILVSTRNHWNPRVKTPNIFRCGKDYKLGHLESEEIDRLLRLVDSNDSIRVLVEKTFSGFSRYEKRRRLVDRCESEMFVCLKNIFASEKFDDIILREYASLDSMYQDIYRHVAAMESSGVRVHRQLVIRILGIPAAEVSAVLLGLSDIVHEYTISDREGLYGWKGRHPVIVSIIARYKFPDIDKLAELFSRVIENISPTYELEVRTIRELCNIESGIPSIPDKEVQNRLLRKMMSVVPGERVPRHRLIRNLIDMGEFEKAETEIRIFEKDFSADGPVARYKVVLLTERACKTVGIMEEDRLAILEQARALAIHSIRRFPYNHRLLAAYADVGVEVYKRTGDYSVYDSAIAELKSAEERLCDPEISRLIAIYERRIMGQPIDERGDAGVEE